MPEELDLYILNTRDTADRDRIPSPAEVRSWLISQGFMAGEVVVQGNGWVHLYTDKDPTKAWESFSVTAVAPEVELDGILRTVATGHKSLRLGSISQEERDRVLEAISLLVLRTSGVEPLP